MGALLPALASLAAPIAARVLIALGLSVVTVVGVSASVSALKDLALAKIGTLPVAALQLGGLLGLWEGLGMVFGAVTFAVTYWNLTRAVRIVGAAS